MDYGLGQVNARPWTGWEQSYPRDLHVTNMRRLAGYGLEADWLTPWGATLLASASKPFGFSDGSWVDPGRKPIQYWLSVSWSH
jgi:hypothetical protein